VAINIYPPEILQLDLIIGRNKKALKPRKEDFIIPPPYRKDDGGIIPPSSFLLFRQTPWLFGGIAAE
jgi:hypothetical protein